MMTRSRLVWAMGILMLLALLTTGEASAVPANDVYSFHPFTMDIDNDTCVPWQEPDTGQETHNCDPVNLIFSGQTAVQVRDALLGQGWSTQGLGSSQSLHFSDPWQHNEQDWQLYYNEGWRHRYHIRLWQDPDQAATVAAVHHEKGLFVHTIDKAWEASEAFVANQLCAAGYSCTNSSPLTWQLTIQNLDPDGDPATWRGWDNNGLATIIAAAAPDTPPSVTILSPADGSSHSSGALISFAGTAVDPEDGDMTANLVWTSNRDGEIGRGGSFSAVLSDGVHTITASVSDSAGNSDSKAITLTVGEATTLAVIVSTDQPTYANRDTVSITVSVSDGSDPVSGANIVLEIVTASGRLRGDEGASDANGIAVFRYRVNSKRDGTGTYTVTATATKEGAQPGSGNATFAVTQ